MRSVKFCVEGRRDFDSIISSLVLLPLSFIKLLYIQVLMSDRQLEISVRIAVVMDLEEMCN